MSLATFWFQTKNFERLAFDIAARRAGKALPGCTLAAHGSTDYDTLLGQCSMVSQAHCMTATAVVAAMAVTLIAFGICAVCPISNATR